MTDTPTPLVSAPETAELLTCPWCGKKAKSYRSKLIIGAYQVECKGGHTNGLIWAEKADAISDWNRRAPTGDAADLIRLRAVVATLRESEARMREALKYGCAAAINSLHDASGDLPTWARETPTWSKGSGIAVMLEALGCFELKYGEPVRAALQGEPK